MRKSLEEVFALFAFFAWVRNEQTDYIAKKNGKDERMRKSLEEVFALFAFFAWVRNEQTDYIAKKNGKDERMRKSLEEFSRFSHFSHEFAMN